MDFKRSAVRICLPPQRLRFQWKGAHSLPPVCSVHSFFPCCNQLSIHTWLLSLHPAPCTSGRFGTLNVEFRTLYSQDRSRKKGAKALNRKAHSPEVHRVCADLPYS